MSLALPIIPLYSCLLRSRLSRPHPQRIIEHRIDFEPDHLDIPILKRLPAIQMPVRLTQSRIEMDAGCTAYNRLNQADNSDNISLNPFINLAYSAKPALPHLVHPLPCQENV